MSTTARFLADFFLFIMFYQYCPVKYFCFVNTNYHELTTNFS